MSLKKGGGRKRKRGKRGRRIFCPQRWGVRHRDFLPRDHLHSGKKIGKKKGRKRKKENALSTPFSSRGATGKDDSWEKKRGKGKRGDTENPAYILKVSLSK